MHYERMFEQESAMFDELFLKQAHARAERVLEEQAIRIEDFENPYGAVTVKRDAAYVKRMLAKFAREATPETRRAKELADVLEVIIYENGDQNEWFGPDSYMILPSAYDDIKNGIDGVVEFQNQDSRQASHLALAVDITYGAEIGRKLQRIKESIEAGRLSEMKYFHSGFLNIHGRKTHIPRVVVGADQRMLHEVVDQWMEKKRRDLAVHPIQYYLLEEIRMQLERFSWYAAQVEQANPQLPKNSQVFGTALSLIERVCEEKQSKDKVERFDFNRGGPDRVFQDIKVYLENFK